MKPYTLTKEQKEHLILMCNILFKPKYGEVQLLQSYCSTPTDLTGSPYLRWYCLQQKKNTWSKEPDIQLIEIHWFEFCCNDLLGELASCQFNGMTDDVIWDQTLMDYWKAVSLDNIHPVDWLWDFYQSIPKGQ